MATSTVAGPSSGPTSNNPSVAVALECITTNSNDVEKGLPGPAAVTEEEMKSQAEHQVRNRLQPALSDGASGERSSELETVNPGSSVRHGNPRVVPTIWRRFWARISPNPLSKPDASQDFEYERGYHKIKPEILEQYTEGIPRLAAFQDSNESFSTYRGFGPYAARLLLHKEIELNNLVAKLDNLDEKDFNSELKYRLQSIEHHKEWDVAQRELLEELEEKLSKYYDFLFKYVKVKSLGRPSPANSRSVLHFMVNNRPLVEGEDDFIFHIDDLLLARKGPQPKSLQGSRLETWLEGHAAYWLKSPIRSFLETENEKRKSADRRIHHVSSDGLSALSDAITVFVAVGLILIPVAILFLVTMSRALMITVALGFVLLFSIIMSVLTGARVQDVIVGTTSYAAVAIMFLGNLSGCPRA